MAITRKHIILVLVGLELMLNASNINLVAFAGADPSRAGQVFALLVMVVAASEVVLALAIVIKLAAYLKTNGLHQLDQLRG